LLQEVRNLIPKIEIINNMNNNYDKLTKIEIVLKEITNLCKKFYEEEKFRDILARKIKKLEISPLLKDIYENPKVDKNGLLVYNLTKTQLKQIEKDAEYINSQKDPDYKIIFRKWWKSNQEPEIDKFTSLKQPHVNIGIKLFGLKEKEIHLLMAA